VVVTDIEATGKRSVTEVRRSRPYHALVGVGLVSYGLLHLIIAWIALQLVFGKRAEASPEGALSQLGRQPLGGVLLWIMAVGLFTLTIWQAVEATIGRDQPGRDGRTRRRLTSAGRAVVYLALGVLAVGVATRTASGSGHGEETISANLMSVPFGQVLVALIAQVVKGVKQNFTEDLDRGAPPSVRRLGTVGYCARGIALAIIGGLFIWAAITYDPDKAGGMDAALSTIRDQPFGSVLLAVMAAGLACFGIYCFFWAKMARY
jgi:cation transporter-like permease